MFKMAQVGTTMTLLINRLKRFGIKAERHSGFILGSTAVLTALSYGMLYLAYFQFYSAFGIRPSDVGLGKLRLLQESLLGPLLMPAMLGFAYWKIGALFLAAIVLPVVIQGWRGQLQWNDAGKNIAYSLTIAICGWWVIATITGFAFVIQEAGNLSDRVYDAGLVVNSEVVRSTGPDIVYPVLDILALPADLTFKSPSGTDEVKDSPPQGVLANDSGIPSYQPGCLLYFGRSKGTIYAFDFKARTTLQIPEESISVALHPRLLGSANGTLPTFCGIRPLP